VPVLYAYALVAALRSRSGVLVGSPRSA